MDASGFEFIEFGDSFLLGWEREGERLTLYLNLLLTSFHPQFEPFDRRKEHGCYKLGRIVASGCRAVRGLPSASQALQWNRELMEFDDVADCICLKHGEGLLVLDTPDFDADLEIEAASFEVIVDGQPDPADGSWPS